jgi:hypothetical protein
MQVLMSEALIGKIDLQEPVQEKTSLMACFIFKDEQLFEKVLQVSFRKTETLNINSLTSIVLGLDEDLALMKKFIKGDKLTRIEIPAFEYSTKIENGITYLLEESSNYGYALSVTME